MENNVSILYILGFLSVTVRQNNIMWFCCFAFIKCCKSIEYEMNKADRRIREIDRNKLSYILVSTLFADVAT